MNSYPSKQCDIIIFGGHGDLAFRKLMPALYHLVLENYLDKSSRIITVMRDKQSNDEHIQLVEKKLKEFLVIDKFNSTFFESFKTQLFSCQIDFPITSTYEDLSTILKQYPKEIG